MSNLQKKILIVQISTDRNGSAISGLSLANGFLERGWETYVAFAHEGPMVQEYRDAGHETSIVPHKSWLRRSHLLRFIKDFWSERRNAAGFEALIDEISPDLVYVNTAVSLAGVMAARKRGVPVVWHLRELFSDVGGEMQAPRYAKLFVRSLFARNADALVVNSRSVAENMLGINLSTRASVVPNAISDECFSDLGKNEARRALGLPHDSVIIGVPGMLRPIKGHSFFFRAMAGLETETRHLLFAVTGDGEPGFVNQLREEVQQLALAEQVVFLGTLDGLATFYRACDIICIPSRAESFGRVVIEAFAAQRPVVATAVGGVIEIVDHGQTGLLVEFGDASQLRKCIEHLISEPTKAMELAANARKKAELEYRETQYITAILKVVDGVTNRTGRSADKCQLR